LPFVRIALQRPEKSSPSSPSAPPKAAAASCCANSVSETMSIFQPVSRCARRAFMPSLPIASASWSSGTTTVASRASSSRYTSRTRAGDSAFATKRAGSGFHGMMSIFSPRSSDTTMRTREPRGPTHAPTGSTPLGVRLDRDLRAVARLAGDTADLDEPVGDLGHLELEQRLDQLGVAAREDHLRALRAGAHLGDDRLDARALLVALAVDLLGARQQRLDLAEVDEDVRCGRRPAGRCR
jgi:hypothetical protein